MRLRKMGMTYTGLCNEIRYLKANKDRPQTKYTDKLKYNALYTAYTERKKQLDRIIAGTGIDYDIVHYGATPNISSGYPGGDTRTMCVDGVELFMEVANKNSNLEYGNIYYDFTMKDFKSYCELNRDIEKLRERSNERGVMRMIRLLQGERKKIVIRSIVREKSKITGKLLKEF